MANVITSSRTGNKHRMRYKDMSATRFHLPTEGQHIVNDMKERGFDKRNPRAFKIMETRVRKMVNDERNGKPMPTVDYEMTGHPLNDLPKDRIGD